MDSTTTILAIEFVSFALATWLFGVNTVQAYKYFQMYNDPLALKLTVVAVIVLDLANTVFTCWGLYVQVVSDFGKPPVFNIYLVLEMIVMILHGPVIQCFFIHSIYLVSGRNKLLPVFIVVLVVTVSALGLVSVRALFPLESMEVQPGTSLVIATITICLSMVTDVVITSSLVIYLFRGKSSIGPTSSRLEKLISYVVQRGFLITVPQILITTFLLLMPNTSMWIAFQFTGTKIYTLTFLANLNRREYLRQTASFNEIEISLHIPMSVEMNGPHVSGDIGSN